MAKIGLKYPVAAVISAEPENAAPTYETGFAIGKAVSANKNIESNDNPLYGDDAIAENDTSFASGTLEIGVTDFGTDSSDTLDIQAKLLGHTVQTTGEEPNVRKSIVKKAGDVAPYLGFGYYKTKKLSGNVMYEATWLYKVQFQLPSEEAQTKGETIEWQTPAISARIMTLANYDNVYEETSIFSSETECRDWINAKANITSGGD